MEQADIAEGKYDNLLISCAESLKALGQTPTLTRLTISLHQRERISHLEARKAVEDFSERGILQELYGPGPYDAWLTAELEKARRLNQGVNTMALAKKLQKENKIPSGRAEARNIPEVAKSMLGLADAADIADNYFLRYGLKPVLGPYPYYGVAIVTITESLLFLPVLWVIHFALGSLLGHPLTLPLFGFVLFLFAGDRLWKNWRKLGSPQRWKSYDDVRERLPLNP